MSIPPALLVMAIFPAVPVLLEADMISPVLISPEAVRVTGPPFPSVELDNSPPPVVSIPPALLVRAIFPPSPILPEYDVISPVLISPEAVRVTEPPFPCAPLELRVALALMAPPLLFKMIFPAFS